MRQASLVFGLFILMSMLFTFTVAASPERPLGRTQNLVSIILDDFNNPEESPWIAVGSRFATEDFPRIAFPRAWPEALHGANREGRDLRVLGVWGRFDRQGFNYIQLIPNRRNEAGEFIGIPIPGRARELDLWVWGSRFDFYMEVHVRDYRGFVHVLDLGSINFAGWRNLSVEFPGRVRQVQRHIPQQQPLSLMKVVIWTRPNERVDNFYVYLDQIKVLTDIFTTRFDGDELADPERVEEIWGSFERR
ncbi:MAG: flagellar filament outer layer protein FlaA [Spirochaetes bacterium]|nr:flagellar filament outer layer protein FlaA [Spirochaetota bacterium]